MESTGLITAGIYLRGESLDPNAVTKVVGVEPTHIHRKGEAYSFKSGASHRRTGVWMLRCKAKSGRLSEVLELLLAKIDLNRWNIGAMAQIEDAELSIFVSPEASPSDASLELTADLLAKIARLGVRMSIEVFCSDEVANESIMRPSQ